MTKSYVLSDVVAKFMYLSLTAAALVFVLMLLLAGGLLQAQDVSSGMMKRAVAIGIASVAAMDAGAPLYAQLLSNGNAVEQLTPPDTFPVLGALKVTGGRRSAPRPYTVLGLDDVARSDNKGPDDYFAPRYRNGKCVEDEGNTLMAEPTFGGGVRKMQGKSLERALASLCRAAALQRQDISAELAPVDLESGFPRGARRTWNPAATHEGGQAGTRREPRRVTL